MISLLDPEGTLIDHRIFRDRCIVRNGRFIKDLRVISNRQLRNMVIVDNSILAFSNQLENGIHIESFSGNRDDTKLKSLVPLLKLLATATDLRERVRELTGIPKLYESFARTIQKS